MKATSTPQSFTYANVIAASRNRIEAEFSSLKARLPRLFQLALNEAEALAWQTGFPELVFPTLAQEKARKVADWLKHQQCIQEPHRCQAMAA